MSTNKKTFQSVTTPIGSLRYPALIEPDTRFDAEGTYQTRIVIDAGDAADAFEEVLVNALTSAFQDHQQKSGGKKLKAMTSKPWERDEDGNLVVKAKLAAQVNTKSGKSWTQRPALFDSKGQRLQLEGLRIGSGTTARLALEIHDYNSPLNGVGITLRLRGVQVIELREPSTRTASDFGFGSEESGFVQETFDNFDEDKETVPAKPQQKPAGKPKVKAQDF